MFKLRAKAHPMGERSSPEIPVFTSLYRAKPIPDGLDLLEVKI